LRSTWPLESDNAASWVATGSDKVAEGGVISGITLAANLG